MSRNWISGWRGAAMAAALAVACALPGLIALPTVDRNEAVFAQGTAQMLDEHNPTDIRFQERVRPGSMPAAHWLQAASVTAFSRTEARAIWAYRLPSLIGLIALVMAAVRGGGRLFGPRVGLASGLAIAVSLLGSTLADLATADALFAGAAAAALAAFAYLYSANVEGLRTRRRDKLVFWTSLIAAFLIKGPMALGVAALAGLALLLLERRTRWMAGLGWGWGLLALLAIAGPWLMAVTVSTDGVFWQGAPSLTRGGGYGLQTAVAPLLLFPASLLLPFAALHAWSQRTTPGVRLALAWLVPSWIALELLPGFQLHGAAGLYVAIVWLGFAGLFSEKAGPRTRIVAGVFSLICAGLLAAVVWALVRFFGDTAAWALGAATMALAAGGGIAGMFVALRPPRLAPLALTGVLGALTVTVLLGVTLPRASGFWPTQNLLQGLTSAGLDPRAGLARGPVAAAGYAEPSLVFHLGAETLLGDAHAAAAALMDHRPAIVSADQRDATLALLSAAGRSARTVYSFNGYDPPEGRRVSLYILKSAP